MTSPLNCMHQPGVSLSRPTGRGRDQPDPPSARAPEGRYVHDGFELAIPGRWRVQVEALLTDFDQAKLSAEVEIR